MQLQAIQSNALSKYGDPRFVLIDKESGEVVDDAQGYGYKSAQKAYAGGVYKFRDKSKDAEKAEKERIIAKWMKENKSFVKGMDQIAFEICKGSWGPDDRFDAKFVGQMLKNSGYTDLPFTAQELFRYWGKGPLYSKRKKKRL